MTQETVYQEILHQIISRLASSDSGVTELTGEMTAASARNDIPSVH